MYLNRHLYVDGDLVVKILNRGYKMASQTSVNNATDEKSSVANSNKKKPLLPAKTKLFVDQAMREKEDPASKAFLYRSFVGPVCKAVLFHRNVQTFPRGDLSNSSTSSQRVDDYVLNFK